MCHETGGENKEEQWNEHRTVSNIKSGHRYSCKVSCFTCDLNNFRLSQSRSGCSSDVFTSADAGFSSCSWSFSRWGLGFYSFSGVPPAYLRDLWLCFWEQLKKSRWLSDKNYDFVDRELQLWAARAWERLTALLQIDRLSINSSITWLTPSVLLMLLD